MNFTAGVDHYSVLGLPSGEEGAKLTEREITRAYKLKALALHPDKRPGDPNAHSDFQKILASYEMLMNPVARRQFDQSLRWHRQMTEAERLVKERMEAEKRRMEEEAKQRMEAEKRRMEEEAKQRVEAEEAKKRTEAKRRNEAFVREAKRKKQEAEEKKKEGFNNLLREKKIEEMVQVKKAQMRRPCAGCHRDAVILFILC
ncbi:hypothetical protein Tsubulata_028660, partial [Turnera subulata]